MHFLREKLARFLPEVTKDRARLEDGDGCAAALRLVIDNRRHAPVGAEREKFRSELLTGPDVDGDHLVRCPRLLEEDRDLETVGRRPDVEIDHRANFDL